LVIGIDFEEDDVFRGVAVEDGFAEKAMVATEIELAQEVAEIRIEIVGTHVLAGHLGLISVKRGEALDLDQARGEAAILVNDAEVGLNEEGLLVLVGHSVLGRNFFVRSFEIELVVEELADEFAASARHLLQKFPREETGSF